MDGIIGRIDWDGCDDCQQNDYYEGCTVEVKMTDLEIEMETDDVKCKLWKSKDSG